MPEPLVFSGKFAGGINAALPARDIGDDQLADARNFLLTKEVTLRKRPGVQRISSTNQFTSAPVRSVHHWRRSNGTKAVIATSGAAIWRTTGTTLGSMTFTDITGGLTLPADAHWEWHQFDDALYGFNGAVTGNNPVKIANTTSNAIAAPAGWTTYPLTGCAAFRRLWHVDAAAPNTIHGSDLGDADAYPGTADADVSLVIGEDEDDGIVAIRAWRGRIMVFKRSRIYQIVPGEPNTDPSLFQVRLYSQGIGCVSRHTIQEVLDDIVFLSDAGVASLAATEKFGDFKQAIMSSNVPSLAKMNKSDPDALASFVHSELGLYGITYRSAGAASGEADLLWTLDYTRALEDARALSWMAHDGAIVGASYARFYESTGNPAMLVGGYDGLYYFKDDVAENAWTAAYAPGDVYAHTKAFAFDSPFLRKDITRISVQIGAETDPVTLLTTYRFDENPGKQRTLSKTFNNLISGSLLAGPHLLGTTFKLSTGVKVDTDFVFAPRGRVGRRGQTVQLRFRGTDWAQRFSLRRLAIEFYQIDGWTLVGE